MGIGGQNDLFVSGIDGVEGMEEFFLGGFFTGQEMDIVDDQQVGLAKSLAEIIKFSGFEGKDKLIGEFLAGDIKAAGLRAGIHYFITNALEQMGFSQPATAMDKERVEMGSGFGHDGFSGAKGELVGRADHKVVQFEPQVGLAARGGVGLLSGAGVDAFSEEFRLGVQLAAALSSKKFRINGENYFHGLMGNFQQGGGYLMGEMVFNPTADEKVGHAHLEIVLLDHQAGGVFKPDTIALLAEFLGDGFIDLLDGISTRSFHDTSPL